MSSGTVSASEFIVASALTSNSPARDGPEARSLRIKAMQRAFDAEPPTSVMLQALSGYTMSDSEANNYAGALHEGTPEQYAAALQELAGVTPEGARIFDLKDVDPTNVDSYVANLVEYSEEHMTDLRASMDEYHDSHPFDVRESQIDPITAARMEEEDLRPP